MAWPPAKTEHSAQPAEPAGRPPILAVDHVSMQFDGQQVLRDLDFAVKRGETLAILGESGCGKTVMLKLLIGLLFPTRGRIIFDGQCLADLDDRTLTRIRLRFGFLFQGAALFDSMSVFDNVAFGLQEHGDWDDDVIREKVRQHLQEVGLPVGVEAKQPSELSGGMKKRVGLARALILEPEVMLYDEPTTGLDPIMSDVINELILQTRSKHPITSIIVTHDMRTVLKVADRIIMLYPLSRLSLDERQIIFEGSPARLRNCPDPRVKQFVDGEAHERIDELARREPRT
jgi:phospholipid/cholesterol/gamma-HCH transport system ATP-binding protein